MANGVSPSLVKVEWSGRASLHESAPRVIVFNQTAVGSPYGLNLGRTVTFVPLLSHDTRLYTCSVIVTGFSQTRSSDSVTVMGNGTYVHMYACLDIGTYVAYVFNKIQLLLPCKQVLWHFAQTCLNIINNYVCDVPCICHYWPCPLMVFCEQMLLCKIKFL